ncbi:MAG: response regulator [Desulfobacteraceae bacterium]|nr:response regulator [Desulfobacteraceae bacterium]
MSDRPSIRIILIDDEEVLLEYMSKRLLKKGFTVKCAFSGEEAVEAAQQEHFDVAVVDLKMPGMGGVETQKRLHEIQPFLQCIVLTGHGSIDSALESGQQDAFRYLLKPLEYDTLVTSINEAHEKKVQLVNEKFQEQVEEIHRSGLGAKGIKKAIDKLRKKYGIQ